MAGNGNGLELERLREYARTRVESRGLPKPGDEDWRFSPLASILDQKLAPAKAWPLTPEEAAPLPIASFDSYRLVFSNGRWLPSLSAIPSNVMVGSIRQGVEDALILGSEERGFNALASMKFEDGALLRVAANTKLDKPVHIIYVGNGGDAEAHYRGVIVLETGASAVVVEEYVGRGNGAFFTNSVMRAELGEGSSLEHYALLREPENYLSVRDFRARLRRDARLKAHVAGLGGGLARCDAHVALEDEGADSELNGLYVAGGKQHYDFHTTVEHAAAHGTSRELYKGVLDGHARVVFNGMIEVKPDAQKTDANVYNKNLLLSENGLVNTKPEFKINANDVQCRHGATIGQLNADALFYLRSRGIGEAQARSLLVYGFASEMLGRMGLEPLREALGARIQAVAGMEGE